MDTKTQAPSKTHGYWMQHTSQKLHCRKNCSITARTRYSHGWVELTPAEVAVYTLCEKCCS